MQYAFLFEVAADAARNDFEEYFAGVCHKGSATIDTTLGLIFFFVLNPSRCVLALLRHAPPPSRSNDIAEVRQGVRISSVDQGLLEFNREATRPNHLAVHHRPNRFLYLVPRRNVAQGHAWGPYREVGDDSLVKSRRVGIQYFFEPPYPALLDEANVTQPLPSSSVMYCVINVLFLFIHFSLRCS